MASNRELGLSSKSTFHKPTIHLPRSQEQEYEDHPNRNIRSETNIWAIGAVICYLIINLKVSSKGFSWQCQGTTNPFWTQDIGLLDPYRGIYSRTLIDTIFMCLAYDPAVRITAVDLVKITNQVEAICHEMYDGVDIGDDPLRDGDLLNARPMGHALLYDACGNGPAKPQPFNLGPVGVFKALGKPFMSPENEGIELSFQGPYTQREAVERIIQKQWRIHLQLPQQHRRR
jgi:serine/threonine protein kinase